MANVTKIWVSVPDQQTKILVQDALVETSGSLIDVLMELPKPIMSIARLTGVVAYVGLENFTDDNWQIEYRNTSYFHCVASLKSAITPDDNLAWQVYLYKSTFHRTGLQPAYLDRECNNILHFLNFGHLYKKVHAI